MIAIRRLTKKFSKQTLSEVKPAPLSETVDHTVEEVIFGPQKGFQADTSRSPSPSPSSSPAESSESEEVEEEEEEVAVRARRRSVRTELPVERVPSAEKRKYSQYKSSTGSSSSGSSSDDEVKEAFESTTSPPSLWPGHTHPWPRPIRVPPTGCRKKVPKYFAQMSSAGAVERPRLDFNKMQYSKRFVMVHRPMVLRHNYSRVHSTQRPTLELALDLSHHSFQPVSAQM